MKTKAFNGAEGYQKPVCRVMNLTNEGVLCSSLQDNIEAEATLNSYTESTESYW